MHERSVICIHSDGRRPDSGSVGKKGWIKFLGICKARTNTVDGAKASKSET